jgi:nicotinate-nucleotide pyrophosphorylase (carboxylating)
VATIRQKADGVISGLAVAEEVFRRLDPQVELERLAPEGEWRPAGSPVLRATGTARGLLTAERTALNFLGRLSGIATKTARVVRAVGPGGARIIDTRKTTPGLRALEKYAVRCGGGFNHRFGLDDAVLIKDNHIAVAGGIRAVLERARSRAGHLVKIEIEVDTLAQLDEVLDTGLADAVLLDNMDVATLRKAVARTQGRVVLEASGNVSLNTIAEIAATGVDYISSGALTHSAPNFDVAIDIAA